MPSKSDSKFIKSLQLKKFRRQYAQFVVEGEKNLSELLQSTYHITQLLVTEEFHNKKRDLLGEWYDKCEVADEKTISQLGTFSSNNAGLAVVKQKIQSDNSQKDKLKLMLDDIRDPGNLGTIIRIADWYGLTQVYCSPTCAEQYNPKVISATMGSFFRINCAYTDLISVLRKTDGPKYGAALGGKNLHHFDFIENSTLIIGNESRGLSSEIKSLLTDEIEIPRLGKAESLNAGVATAIFCDNFFRQIN